MNAKQLNVLYNKLADWVIGYGPRLILGILVMLLGIWLINRLLKWWQSGLQSKNVDASLKPFLISLVGVVLRILLVLGVMSIIGVEITLFATVIGALGVAAGLALSGTLQNFASGVLILLLKPFSVGDNIISQGNEGTVTSIQIFYTIVTTFDNRTVIIPNSKLSNETIVNISRQGNRRIDLDFKFPNAVDLDEARNVINSAIDRSQHILAKPERRIGVASVDPDGYHLMVNVWVNAHGFQDTKMALLENIIQDLKKSGIKLPGL